MQMGNLWKMFFFHFIMFPLFPKARIVKILSNLYDYQDG